MRHAALVLVAVIAGVTPAAATGGLGCEADDANVKFDVDSGVTRGMGGPFLNFRASLDVVVAGVPDDLRKLTLDDAMTHSWLDGEEVKLQFYVERQEGDFASLDFVVETTMVEEGEYRGDYVLTVFAQFPPATDSEARSVTGKVVCYAE